MSRRHSFSWCLLLLSCGGDLPCYRPPYEDLSRWAPQPAKLDSVCGVPTRAELLTPAGEASVLAKYYDGAPGDTVWVSAHLLRDEGPGKLSALIWEKYTYGMSGPDAKGQTTLWAMVPTGHATITFLAQATTAPLRWEVRDVLISTIEVVR